MPTTNRLVEEIITEIYISNDTTPWLIVEGNSDCTFFNGISTQNLKLISAHGWENVATVISKTLDELKKNNVFGVIDKDFREALGITQTAFCIKIKPTHIFETDNADLLFHCDSAAKKVLLAHSSTSKLKDVVQAIDSKKLINHINGKNVDKANISHDIWTQAQQAELPNVLQSTQRLCNGHDLMAILGIALKKKFGSNNAKEVEREKIEKDFRLAYSRQDFETTQLYAELSGVMEI